MLLVSLAYDYRTRSYFPFTIQIIMTGDLILLACRKRVFLKVPLCYFQKSLEGWFIRIHKSNWHPLASASAFVRAILAMSVQRPSQTSFCKIGEYLASTFEKDAEEFHVIEVVMEGRAFRTRPVLGASTTLPFPHLSSPLSLLSCVYWLLFCPHPHGVEHDYLNQARG